MIRLADPSDTAAILDLNEASVAVLSPMDRARYNELAREAALVIVSQRQVQVESFLMGFRDGASYDSDNYAWFSQRYHNFFYVDRIVVAAASRGQGLAAQMYSHVVEWSQSQGLSFILAEVVCRPPNIESLAFHRKFGFEEVAIRSDSQGKQQAMLALPLE